ncbi:MAG: PQQ-dependent sugar dehydrogenase [Nitrososphaerales archaeon]
MTSVLIGYGLLKARKIAWKTAVLLSSFSIALGIGIILLIGFDALNKDTTLFPYRPLKSPLYATLIGCGYSMGGVALLSLLMRESIWKYCQIRLAKGNSILERKTRNIVIVVSASVVATSFSYVYATETFGTYNIDESEQIDSEERMARILAEPVVQGLGDCGTSFVFVPDGRIFCGELKSGRVRLIENFQLSPDPLITLNDFNIPKELISGERGLTGITIDPEFQKNHYAYLHWTYLDLENNKTYNRVARFTESNNKLTNMTMLMDRIPGNKMHNGGPLEFGYDGKLYVTTGDALGRSKTAQNIKSLAGKVLRINPDGSIPKDNPFPESSSYTLGHRNVFGIGFHPLTKIPYVTENGPTCCDEVNMLIAGKNYGYSSIVGRDTSHIINTGEIVKSMISLILAQDRFMEPLLEISPTIAPTELIFYTGDKYDGEANNMFFTSWNTRELYRVTLKPPYYDKILSIDKHFIEFTGFGGLLDIEQGPDGYLYVSSFDSIMRLVFEYSNKHD